MGPSCPTGSADTLDLAEVADELATRLIGIFGRRPDGTRPVFGSYQRFQSDAAWIRLLPFHEYFHGDTGAGWARHTRRDGRAWSPI